MIISKGPYDRRDIGSPQIIAICDDHDQRNITLTKNKILPTPVGNLLLVKVQPGDSPDYEDLSWEELQATSSPHLRGPPQP